MSEVNKPKEYIKHAIILGVLSFSLLPFYIMLNISLKTNDQFVQDPFWPTPPFHWENWIYGWNLMAPYIANSIFVSVISVSLILFFAMMAAYVFARYSFPGKGFLWYALLGLMFMPSVMNLVTVFSLIQSLGLLNTLMGVITLMVVGGQVFCVFVLRNFIEEIPQDLFEAAEVDGATPMQQIFNIVVPMSGSILSTLAILQFIGIWNNFITPMIFIFDEYKQLLPVALMRLDGEYVKEWGLLMAGFSIAAIPLVLIFLFSMRLFVKGLAAGAVKG